MGFRSFRANVLARLVLLTSLIAAFAWSLVNTGWQATPLVCGVLAVIVGVELVRYVESVNRELASFLNFVSHHDFSAAFPIGDKGRVFRELEGAYKLLTGEYRNLNLEKAANHQYLESVIEHVSTALVCFDDDGKVALMNQQAKQLFASPYLHSVRSFRRIDPKLPALLDELGDGDRRLIELTVGGEPMQLALFATKFQLLDHHYTLISFQNIRDELEQREVDFSQKLIKVMTHEIMNSVTPIIALSKVIEQTLLEARAGETALGQLEPGEREDLVRSVASIQSRGSGLLRFVQAYSTLTNLPRPRLTTVDVAALLAQVATLMTPTLEAKGVTLETDVRDTGLAVRADAEQLQQVLINLVNNALDALDGQAGGKVMLVAAADAAGKARIQVLDNGPGIEPEHLDSIFVPFFTTKRHGTGVGLSVSRQIMFLNKGLISVKSTVGRGTEFTLRFK